MKILISTIVVALLCDASHFGSGPSHGLERPTKSVKVRPGENWEGVQAGD